MSMYEAIVAALEVLKRQSGLVELKTHTLYAGALGPDSVVVDLGANVGQFSETMTEVFGCRAYAVEAIPSVFARIPDTPSIAKFNCAISDVDGPVMLYLSDNAECNSIDESIARENGFKGIATCDGLTFETFLTRHAITKVDLLKVDIEGAEDLLFDSTSDEVLASIDQITIEFHDFVRGSISSEQVRAIVRRLEKLGFYCLPFSYVWPDAPTADFLFIRLDRVRIPRLHRLGFAFIKQVLRFELAKSSLRAELGRLAPTSS